MAKGNVAQARSNDRASSQGKKTAAELRGIADSLSEALGDIIEAHEGDGQAFSEALRKVNSARVVLRGEAEKLEVQP